MSDQLVKVRDDAAVAVASGEWSVKDLVAQVTKIQQAMKAVMRENEHFGVIPGTPKPTLFKPGAEKLCLLFRLDPQFDTKETRDGNHLTVVTTCTLYSLTTGQRMGSGMGTCSTREAKYGWRTSQRKCPKCGKETIFKSKQEPGFYCWVKKGGCGAKFGDADKAITDQKEGRVENPDLPDMWNTVLKMSNKRALVAAVLVVTGASDIFTQDVEDLAEVNKDLEPAKPMPKTTAPMKSRVIDVEAEAIASGYPVDEFGTPPDAEPEQAHADTGMPGELKEILDQIAAAKDEKALALAAIEASKLEPSLIGEARRAYTARQKELKGGGK